MDDADPPRRPRAVPPLARRRRSRFRGVRAAIVAILSLYVAYVAAINVVLSTSLFDRIINHDPETLDVRYRRGWSLFPGSIHARDLHIRASDSNVEWLLTLDEVTFDVSLLGLARRRFDVAHAHGRGITMRVRQKLDASPDSVEQVAWLPQIAGFPAYSVRPAGPPSPERWDDTHYALWTVQLEDVIADDVREVWIDGGRFEGNARVTGRFYLKPIRAVDVGPTHVDVREGRITAGRSLEIAKHVAGTSDVTIDRFDPRFVEGADVLRHVTIGTELAASFADPATLPFTMPGGVHVSTEIDAPRLAVNVKRGAVTTGTRIELATKRVQVSKDDLIATAAVQAAVTVANDGAGDRLRADLTLDDLTLVRADAARVLRAPRVTIGADARELDLTTAPLHDVHATVHLDDVELPDAAVLDAYVPSATIGVLAGSARASARVELFSAEERASGSLDLRADALALRLGRMQARGSVTVAASFDGYRWEQGFVEDAKLSAVVADVSLAAVRAPAPPKLAAGTLLVDARASRIDVTDPLRSLEVSLEIPDASVAGGQLRDGVATAHSRFALDGRVTIEDHLARGRLHARSENLALEIGDLRVRAAVEARARVRSSIRTLGDLAIDDASIDVTGVAISRGKAPRALATIKRLAVALRSPAFAFTDPFALAAPFPRSVDGRLVIEGAAIPDARAIETVLLPAGGAIRIESGSARASCDVRISSSTRTGSGSLVIDVARGGIAVHETRLTGDFGLRATVVGFDPETSTLDLSGSHVTMRAVAVEQAAAETKQWRGDLALESAALRLRHDPGLDAILRLDADDARPLLGVLLRDSVPAVLVDLVDTPHLDAYARLRFAPHGLVLSDVSASGGDVALRGAYALRDQDRHGAFIVEKGPFSVGLGLGKDGAKLRFFNLDAWLGAQVRTMKTKARTPALQPEVAPDP